MTILLIMLGVAAWIALGCISRGYYVGYFAHKYPYFRVTGYVQDMFLGPIALLATLRAFNFNHWRWNPPTKEEAWQAYQKAWPMLSYESFDETWERKV